MKHMRHPLEAWSRGSAAAGGAGWLLTLAALPAGLSNAGHQRVCLTLAAALRLLQLGQVVVPASFIHIVRPMPDPLQGNK